MERAELRPPPSGPAPVFTALLSLLVPGLGQIASGRRGRGGLLLLLAAVVLGLIAWLRAPTLLLALLPFWLFNARDAYQLAGGERPNTAALFLLAALPLYVIGWRITEISLDRLINNASKARPLISGLMRPALVEQEVDLHQIAVPIQVPCAAEPPAVPAPAAGEALVPSASCGAVGDALAARGSGFPPNQAVEIWWINPVGAASRIRINGTFAPVVADAQGNFDVELAIPNALRARVDAEADTHTLEARYVASRGAWHLTPTFWLVLGRMGETIAQGLMATFAGAVVAAAISFFGARNLMGANAITRVLYYVARTIMNVLRSVEPLIMAIVFVVWVGLGPFAGVLALIVHTVAALGKLYSEAIESIEPGPIEAIRATGANQLQTIVYAVLPQVLPPWIAFTVYRWDINVRMSTIIGFVGGGGIGFLLAQWIRLSDFRAAGAAIWAIAVVVVVLDFLSARVRARVI